MTDPRTPTELHAESRQEVADMLREVRGAGGIAHAVVYGSEWVINMGAGGLSRITIRP